MIALPKKRTRDEIYAELAAVNPEAVVADGFEDAYIGYTYGMSSAVAVYDYYRCISVLVSRDGMSPLEAVEFLDHNTVFAYVGQFTPIFLIADGMECHR